MGIKISRETYLFFYWGELMKKQRENIAKKVYTPPGTYIHVGDKNLEEAKIVYTSYDRDKITVSETRDLDEILDLDQETIKWLDIIGLHDVDFIEELGTRIGVHPLVIEDILNTSQSSKIEDYEDYLFIVIKNIYICEEDEENEFEFEQICFLLFKNMVISFQERKAEAFSHMESRLKKGSYLRNGGADDLLHALMDYIVDNYFLAIEKIGKDLDIVEDVLLESPERQLLERIYIIKKSLIYIRSILWPMRNVFSSLSKNEYNLIDGKTVYYMRDIYDHTIQILEIIETYREIYSDMLATYLSSIGNKTNDVMKVLTIFSTIFIPLSFLTGVYGMNFTNFPELNWKYGYISFWVLSLGVIVFMFRFFKKRDWI